MRIHVAGLTACALLPVATVLFAQDVDTGRKSFESRCARCHGADGTGGEMGPSIIFRLPSRDDQQLGEFIHEGLPARGMPPGDVPAAETAALVKFLRSIERRPEAKPVVRITVQTTAGRMIFAKLENGNSK